MAKLTFRIGQGQIYANRKPTCAFIFNGTGNILLISDHFRDIRNPNTHDLDLDLDI